MSLGVNSGVSLPTQKFQTFCQEISASVFVSVENATALANMGSFRQRFLDNAVTGKVAKRYLRKEFSELLKLPSLWTRSYFASTAGNVSSEIIKKYIAAQKGL